MFGRVPAAAFAAGLTVFAGWAFAERPPADGTRAARFEAAFEIHRNGEPIGIHRYVFTLADTTLTVSSEAHATVTLLGLPVYRFTHQVHEVWKDGRLVELQAATDDNGERTRVSARATAEGLVVEGPLGRTVASLSAVPTTYWNFGTVAGAPLIDTRDGEVMTRAVTPLAWERVAVSGDGEVAARRYRIHGRMPCDVWYDAEGVWLRAACDTKHGRIEDVALHVSGSAAQLVRLLTERGGDRLARDEPAR